MKKILTALLLCGSVSAFAQIGDTPYTLSQNKVLGNQNLKSAFNSSKTII